MNILLFSGGMDSTTLLSFMVRNLHLKVIPIFIDYGQNHARQESKAVNNICKFYNLDYKEINLPNFLESGLTNNEVPFWIYTLKVRDRNKFMEHMQERNITTSRVHERNDIHTAVRSSITKLPELDSFIDDMICIPVGWWVTGDEREYIVECIKEGW